MRRINKILIGLILIATMFLSIGYSAIENITLDIKGMVTASQTTFPYLPTGFSKVEGTTLETGLVIQDGSGNQYVWVEVPKTAEVYEIGEEAERAGLNITEFTEEEFAKIEYSLKEYSKTYGSSTYKDEFPNEETVQAVTGYTLAEYKDVKQKMLKSVYENGGFYIGRYEVGTEEIYRTNLSVGSTTEIPVIKANAYPYTWVTCSEAQILANKMPSGEYTSSLMFGVQWDLVLKYFEIKGASISSLKQDSTNWGNYYGNLWKITNVNLKYGTSLNYNAKWISKEYMEKTENKGILLSTGADVSFSKQNIYDIAGNVYEYTLGYSSSTSEPGTARGGAFDAHRFYTSSYKSFRV